MRVNIEGNVTDTWFLFKIHAKLSLWIAGEWIFGREVIHTATGSKTQMKIHRAAKQPDGLTQHLTMRFPKAAAACPGCSCPGCIPGAVVAIEDTIRHALAGTLKKPRVVLTVLAHEGKRGDFRAFNRGKAKFQPTPPGSTRHCWVA